MEPSNATPAHLIERARKGERSAQEALWRAHRRWVAAIVIAHRPRSIEVDDLMQDVALRMIDKLHTLRTADAFKPWLRQIVLNTCRGSARALKPTWSFGSGERDEDHRHDGHHAPEPQSHEATSAESAELRDAAERLLAQAMTLPPEYREPLILRCVRSMSYQQIGEVLDLPVTTIETRLARARRMLREELGEEHPDEVQTRKRSTSQQPRAVASE